MIYSKDYQARYRAKKEAIEVLRREGCLIVEGNYKISVCDIVAITKNKVRLINIELDKSGKGQKWYLGDEMLKTIKVPENVTRESWKKAKKNEWTIVIY